ncbi:hypothetical protein KDH_19880 [Dictyobacter sp. S3.2.2.5]|uniref:HTH tetR-type domain-containing protein n=2 Tax=Dictyobacter halimunensis TaxID=3026934 RepID=A0ABQ6FLJ5_9CHLR|nr:hypothetical protein KDH_19880 [Dictyobacter sp. S3.2.2.5]
MEDIAKQAGVVKKTVYLHWKSREELFETLLLREWLATIEELKQRLAADPAGATISSLARHVVYITINNPLFRATLLQDREMLGDLTHTRVGQTTLPLRMEMVTGYLEQLRQTGLLRTDIEPATQLKIISAIFMGFFMVDQFLPANARFRPEEMAESLAYTLHRAVEPDEPYAPEAVEKVTRTLDDFLNRLIGTLRPIYEQRIF